MTRTVLARAAIAAVVLVAAVWAWQTFWPSEERAIRRRLHDLAETVNEDTPEGLGNVARAAQIGSYFSHDVVVDLGQGSPPIHGRESLIGMAARLPPRAAGYSLEFDDVTVSVNGDHGTAAVTLIATFTRRNDATGEQSIDARELQLGMLKTEGLWRIARVSAVDVLRRK